MIYCHIQANAKNNAFAGLMFTEQGLAGQDFTRQGTPRLKIRVNAPATEGVANKCLIKYLASQFGVAKSHIELVKGQTTRYKTIAIKAPKKIPEQTQIPPG